MMNVNYACRFSRCAALVLAVALIRPAPGAETVATDDGASDVVVVMSDGPGDVELPPAAPSAIVVRNAEGQPAAGSDSAAAMVILTDEADSSGGKGAQAPQGAVQLSVVANQDRATRLTPVVRDPAVEPASSVEAVEDHEFYAEGPFSCEDDELEPGAVYAPPRHYAKGGTAMRQRVQTLVGGPPREAGRMAQRPARNGQAKPRTARGRTATPSANDSPAALLVRAHELSQTAATEAQYSQIVKWCQEATAKKLDDESRAYAAQLTAWALNRRGQLRADQGQRELAMADFQAALKADPNCWRAVHNRGVTFAQNGQFAEAFDDICRVIELNPKFAKAYSNRATLYVQASDLQNALEDYDRAVELDPTLTAALVGRGRVRHMQGQLAEALEDLTAAVKLAPTDAEIVCSRADLLADLGRYHEAVDDYARAIDLNPRFEHAFRNGAWLLATCPDDSVRDVEGALAGAKAALNCGYGDRHAALDTLAAALANAGRFDEAVSTMHQAMDIAPEELQAVYAMRLELYESKTPFRTRPIKNVEVQTAEFVEIAD